MSWSIKAITGPFAGQEVLIDQTKVIGRDPSVDIVLQGGHISRKHAELSVRDNMLWVKDLNSSNGTYVNGARITEQQLNKGDELQLDVVRFVVHQALTASVEPVSGNSKAMPALLIVILAVVLAVLAWFFLA